MEHSYDHKKVEQKWQKIWEEKDQYKTDENSKDPKYYVLDMYPYPSGDGLHVGHVEGYTATDIYSRFKRRKGFNVLHPMGWDAFGLPAENYAVKTGVHPKETTEKAINNFRKQIKSLGLSYDWDREVGSHNPDYYKWTQWFFLTLFKNGLAYKKTAKVNWDPVDQTVLANEQVLADGTAERSGAKVIQKDLEQWFFKITDFAEDLVNDLDEVDWPESTITNQRNWIGKSKGAEISFEVKGSKNKLKVFTTRPDTLFGATYMVLAPEHELIEKLSREIKNLDEVRKYVEDSINKTDIERTSEGKEKTGIELKGIKAINPTNNEEIPIFVADYVLVHYGTGAIMAVPAHDKRDWEFAKKFDLPIVEVISGGDVSKEAFTENAGGKLTNSGKFDGLSPKEARGQITEFVGGEIKTTYKLRDWLISRQRYWGAPIPVVYDPEGNPHAIPEEHLPWLLPTDVEFKPTGVSPLASSKELLERTEKIFGKGWRPEVDTMDTFVCSSWYFFRFTDSKNIKEFASKERLEKWMPVDLYVGGAEHTVLHLMYARFFTKVLHRLGLISFNEPFVKLRHQGIVLAEDGNRMSKSKDNVINPDDIMERFGSDTLRMYEMFMGPFNQNIAWSTDGLMGPRRFLDKLWRASNKVSDDSIQNESLMHETIKRVEEDIEEMRFNTAISSMMVYLNEMNKGDSISKDEFKTLLLLLAPFAPHITEELWEKLGEKSSIHLTSWPVHDKKKIVEDKHLIVIQVNGKVRGEIETKNPNEEELKRKGVELPRVKAHIEGKEIKKIIYIDKKLINIVV